MAGWDRVVAQHSLSFNYSKLIAITADGLSSAPLDSSVRQVYALWLPAKRLRLLASQSTEPGVYQGRHMHFSWLCVTCLCACCAAMNPFVQVTKSSAVGGGRGGKENKDSKNLHKLRKVFQFKPRLALPSAPRSAPAASGARVARCVCVTGRRLLIYHCKVQWHFELFCVIACRRRFVELQTGGRER